MTTHVPADIKSMETSLDHDARGESGMPEGIPHDPPSRRRETRETRAARLAALTRAVRNGTYDTEVRASLGAEALFEALVSGARRPRP